MFRVSVNNHSNPASARGLEITFIDVFFAGSPYAVYLSAVMDTTIVQHSVIEENVYRIHGSGRDALHKLGTTDEKAAIKVISKPQVDAGLE